MHAREEGGPRKSRGKGKEHRNNEGRRRVASSQARDARGAGGAATSHGKHNTTKKRKRGGHQGDRRREAAPRTSAPRHSPRHHAPTSTQTPHRHHTHHTHPRPAARPEDRRRIHPRPHHHAHSTWTADSDSPPRERPAGGGKAPEPRRPSQRRKALPPGTPSCHPQSAQRRLARAHAVGPVLGPDTHTNRALETRVAEPWPPAPKDGRPGEGHARHQMLLAMAEGHPPPGTAPHHPRGTQPPTGHASQGDSAGPPHPHTRAHSTWVADPNSSPRGRAAGGGRAPEPRRPSQQQRAAPRGRPPAIPTARNDGSQERTLWDPCWVPDPTQTAAGTHGLRNPACPAQRTGGRGTDSA